MPYARRRTFSSFRRPRRSAIRGRVKYNFTSTKRRGLPFLRRGVTYSK